MNRIKRLFPFFPICHPCRTELDSEIDELIEYMEGCGEEIELNIAKFGDDNMETGDLDKVNRIIDILKRCKG